MHECNIGQHGEPRPYKYIAALNYSPIHNEWHRDHDDSSQSDWDMA